MRDIIKNFLDTTNERIKNPFIGAFIISWIVCNWKGLSIYFLSDYKIEAKINIIQTQYSGIWNNLYLPIIIALIYIVALPYFMWFIEELVKKSNSGRKKNLVKQQIEDYQGKQELAIEESKLEDLKANYREKADLNNQIEKLREQIDERDKQIADDKKEIKNLKTVNANFKNLLENSSKIKSEHTDKIEEFDKLYREFQSSDLFKHFEDIGRTIRKGHGFPHFIDDIIQEKYIFKDIVSINQSENKSSYDFTEKGNYFWKKYVMSLELDDQIKKEELVDDDLPF